MTRPLGPLIGMVLGLGVGFLVGSSTGDPGMWIPIGIGFGALTGLLVQRLLP